MFEKKCYLDGIVDGSDIFKNICIIFSFFLGVAFCKWSMFLSKAPISRNKLLYNNFYWIVLLFASGQKVSQIFKIQFLTGNINIMVLCCVVSVLHFQIKSSFSSEETNWGREALKI